MHLGPLCMQLRAPISFFLLLGANSSPEKVQHFLVSPNSIKIVPNGMFFGAATGSGVLLCWGFFPKDRTYRAFFVLLHKRNFFRMVPEGLSAFGSFVHAAESAS